MDALYAHFKETNNVQDFKHRLGRFCEFRAGKFRELCMQQVLSLTDRFKNMG